MARTIQPCGSSPPWPCRCCSPGLHRPATISCWVVDAPELTELGGADATAALERLVGGRVVRLEFAGERRRDNFGRLLCRVYVDGVDVGQALVTEGHAMRR